MYIFANFFVRILILFKHKTDLREYLFTAGKGGKSVGLVPTMGALHEGHISLIENSRRQCDITVCSVFVNPTQFNDPTDLDKYPRTIENDILMLEEAGVDALFFPEVREMYDSPVSEKFELRDIAAVFEGSSRPGHFDGVATIVKRLFEAVLPDKAFFGMKDYQQCLVINELASQSGPEIVICPTVREPNGLAMSSRNRRLSPQSRDKASAICLALQSLKRSAGKKNLQAALKEAEELILSIPGARIDYLSIADAESLKKAESWDDFPNLIAITAVFVDEVRLIDNLIVKGKPPFTLA